MRATVAQLAADDSLALASDRATSLKSKYGLTLTHFDDIDATSRKEWLVKGFLGAGELSCQYGPPGSAKSALAGDLAAHVAGGREWHGRRVQQGAVLFVAAERVALVKRRFAAFRQYYGIDTLPLAVISGAVDLRSSPNSAEGIIACGKQLAEQAEMPLRLVVIDTVNRVLAGGDENSSKDMGALIGNIDRIQHETGAHILVIHHVPHDQNRMRGHGALLAACDTTIQIDKTGDVRVASIEKLNDGEEGERVSFTLESFDLSVDRETGEATTAPIVRPAENKPAPQGDKGQRLKPNQQTMFQLLFDAREMTVEDWNEKAREAGIGVRRKADLVDIRGALKARGLIRQTMTGWAVRQ